MFDLASLEPGKNELTHNGNSLSDIYATRIARIRKSGLFKVQQNLSRLRSYDFHSGISVALIEGHLLKLRTGLGHDSTKSLERIFGDLAVFLQDKGAVEMFLYLMPKSREGVGIIANALFSESAQVRKLATLIFQKLR